MNAEGIYWASIRGDGKLFVTTEKSTPFVEVYVDVTHIKNNDEYMELPQPLEMAIPIYVTPGSMDKGGNEALLELLGFNRRVGTIQL